MTETLLTHDAGVSAFEDASGVVSTDDDGVNFSWDEEHIVRVDAPADLKGAFDTERFYKIDGATIARPIKQPYMVGDDIEWYKKPAEELQKAAWSFDNKPFTLGHPETGMVKDVDDIHGFWRNVRYNADEDRLKEDLYVPINDQEALDWLEENSDVSVGFYNRVRSEYDGDTGDLTDDNVDGFQVDMYGNHIAGVEKGRCSGEDGCGLDDQTHGNILDPDTVTHQNQTTDAPSGIHVAEDGTWLAVGPDEHPDDNTEHPDDGKFPVDSCSDVEDAWQLRGHTDGIDIDKSTLANRIERVDDAMGCDVVPDENNDEDDPQATEDCGCNTMSNDNTDGFDIPDLSVDAIVEQNDAVKELKEERDSYKETVDSLREDLDEVEETLTEAFDSAEHFSVELEEDECPCEAVEDLVADLDEKAAKVEDLSDELEEYREDEREDALDRLDELGADREEWAEEDLDSIEEEIDRREEVLDAAPDVSVKDIDSETDEDSTDADETTMSGTRRFGRGHKA